MDLPINAAIGSIDGLCIPLIAIILNPVSDPELVVKPANDEITQFALREVQLWQHQDVTPPVTCMKNAACWLTLGSVATAATMSTVIVIQ